MGLFELALILAKPPKPEMCLGLRMKNPATLIGINRYYIFPWELVSLRYPIQILRILTCLCNGLDRTSFRSRETAKPEIYLGLRMKNPATLRLIFWSPSFGHWEKFNVSFDSAAKITKTRDVSWPADEPNPASLIRSTFF